MGQRNEIAESFGRLVTCILQQSSLQGMPSDSADQGPRMQTQLLYERWLREPEWLLRAEGIPLLIGIEPDAWETLRASGACGTLEHKLVGCADVRRRIDRDRWASQTQ